MDQVSDDELSINAPQGETQQDRDDRHRQNCRCTVRRRNATALAQRAHGPVEPRNLQHEFDEVAGEAFNNPAVNIAEAAILMQNLPDKPKNRRMQHLTRRALYQIDRQIPAPSGSRNSRTPAGPQGDQEANQAPRPAHHQRPRFQDESYHEGQLRSYDHGRGNFRDAREIINARRHGRPGDETDRFPALSQNINYAEYTIGFNPANMQNLKKYDGKQDPRQWLRIYSTAIEVAGGTNYTKVIYFPMALESAPLTWLENLKRDSIHSWEDLKKLFIDNFQGSIHRPATRHDLRLCKQELGEALRSYLKRFFDTCSTIANIADDDVIDCFHNGLATQQCGRTA